MLRTKILLLCLVPVLVVSSCIKPYEPDIRSSDKQKYVVTGQVTDGGGDQTVNVSLTSPIGDPHYIPVQGCFVRIFDDKGNTFYMTEMGNGDYYTWIDPSFLIPGASFKIEVETRSGENIVSDFDQLMECPDVDSIYFERKEIQSDIAGQITKGIQFYIDLDARASNARYFRWEATETWEYQADYPVEWYFDGEIRHVSPPDYSRKVCWSTTAVPDIFTLTTNNLVENKYMMLPLHFVSNRTSRLMYGYSLLIRQYALSEAAYSYWDQLRINSSQQGGLYEKQPLAIVGNMHNTTHPEEDVLGFFGASSVKTKRVFIQDVPDLALNFSTLCYPGLLEEGFSVFEPYEYPIYLMGDKYGYTMMYLNEECVNCLKLGGTNVKPEFWPN